MSVRKLFTPAELAAVREAVARAEGRTAGEIVAVVASQSDDYEETLWKGAALGALGAALGAAGWAAAAGLWVAGPMWTLFPPLVGAGVGYAAARWLDPVRRALAGTDLLALRVARRAAEVFLEEEVFDTRNRTGILLFLSMFERRVQVLADAGIHATVPAATWESVATDLAAGIRAGHAHRALLAAIDRCGRLLEEHGLERPPDDTDELADGLRFRDD